MKKHDSKILTSRKQKLVKRLERKQYADQSRPMFKARNIQYEMTDRIRAIDCGGIGAFHLLARNSGLTKAIDSRLMLLKQHKPYHESDHVLNLAYNTLSGGTCLDDIELHRNDEAYMVMASLAWTLKAWFALLVRRREHRDELLAMEFRRFLNGLVRIPAQIITAGRRITYRILGYNQWVYTFLKTFDRIRQLRMP